MAELMMSPVEYAANRRREQTRARVKRFREKRYLEQMETECLRGVPNCATAQAKNRTEQK